MTPIETEKYDFLNQDGYNFKKQRIANSISNNNQTNP
jgi:hypothetical protein